jgi:hypothetical protein
MWKLTRKEAYLALHGQKMTFLTLVALQGHISSKMKDRDKTEDKERLT